MVRLTQKIWYRDGSTKVQVFESGSEEAAMRLAYEALDCEIKLQWDNGRVTIVKALCGEHEVVEAVP